ncbi:hypothetical protein [Flavobacterium sp.]|uniref:hypothetical protein n=1 Tax=Flavobacterium sp. TaxID=239 RepID=UPI0025CE6F4C|nr:hypothetical protein [Flavobacterium sp.]
MTTITLKINKNTKAGKLLASLIELLSKEANGVEILESNSKSGISEAFDDVKSGKINSYKDSNELFKKVLNV